MIDWAALVADLDQNLPKNEAKPSCSDKTCPNKPQNSENVRTAESRTLPVSSEFVRTCRTVRTTFEGPRVDEYENNNPSSFVEPVGDGIEGQSAPHKKACESSCRTCAHFRRPGLSDGHCGGRDDLPFAYTPGHPLRQLPADGGADCSAWQLHPALDGADLSPSRLHRRP